MRARHQDLTAHCHLPHRTPGLIEQRKAPLAAAGPHLGHEASAPEKQGEGGLERDPVLSSEKTEAEPHSPVTCPATEQEQSVKRVDQACPPEPGAREERRMGPQRSPWGSGKGRLFFREAALSATAVGKPGTFAVRFGC